MAFWLDLEEVGDGSRWTEGPFDTWDQYRAAEDAAVQKVKGGKLGRCSGYSHPNPVELILAELRLD